MHIHGSGLGIGAGLGAEGNRVVLAHGAVGGLQGHGLGLAAVMQTGALGAGDVERVGDAAEALRDIEWTVAPLPACIG